MELFQNFGHQLATGYQIFNYLPKRFINSSSQNEPSLVDLHEQIRDVEIDSLQTKREISQLKEPKISQDRYANAKGPDGDPILDTLYRIFQENKKIQNQADNLKKQKEEENNVVNKELEIERLHRITEENKQLIKVYTFP